MKDRNAMTEGPDDGGFQRADHPRTAQTTPGGTGGPRGDIHHEDEAARLSVSERGAVDYEEGPIRSTNRPGIPDERVVDVAGPLTEGERTIELREEELVAHKDFRELGEVVIRTEIEEVPGRLEVEAQREEVEIEHVPVGQFVSEREDPWEEDGVLVVPVYEEQLVVVKRLVLREHLRIRRVRTAETHLYEDTLRRDHLIIEDPNDTGLVHEQYPNEDFARGEDAGRRVDHDRDRSARRAHEPREEGNLLENIENAVRRVFH